MESSGRGFPVPTRPTTPFTLRSQLEFYMTGVSLIDGPSTAAMSSGECTICLERLTEDVIRIHACDHMFHTLCIISWFDTNAPRSGIRRGTCPNCRCELYEPDYLSRVMPEEDGVPGSIVTFEEHEEQHNFYENDEDDQVEDDYDYDDDLYILDNYEYSEGREEHQHNPGAQEASLSEGGLAHLASSRNSSHPVLRQQPRRRRPLTTSDIGGPIARFSEMMIMAQVRAHARIRSASMSRSPGPEGHEVDNGPVRGGPASQPIRRDGRVPPYSHLSPPSRNNQTHGPLAMRSFPALTHEHDARISAREPQGAAPVSVRHNRDNTTASHRQNDSFSQGSAGGDSFATSSTPPVSSASESAGQVTVSRRAMRQGLRRLSEDFRMHQLRFHSSETDATAHDSS